MTTERCEMKVLYFLLMLMAVESQHSDVLYTGHDYEHTEEIIDNHTIDDTKFSNIRNASVRPENVNDFNKKENVPELPDTCFVGVIKEAVYVNCSKRQLKNVPKLPTGSTEVDLSHNDIQKINNHSFKGLSVLKTLDLSDNPLRFIDEKAFSGLHQLSRLYIQHSNLSSQHLEYVDLLVANLTSLAEFSLTYNYEFQASTRTYCFCGETVPLTINALNTIYTLELDSSLFSQFNTIDNRRNKSVTWNVRNLLIRNSEYCFFALFTKECFKSTPFLNSLKVYNTLLDFGSFSNDLFNQSFRLEDLTIDQQMNESYYIYRWNGIISSILRNISTSVSKLTSFKSLAVRAIAAGTTDTFSLTDALKPLGLSNSIETVDVTNNAFEGYLSSMHSSSWIRLRVRNNCLRLHSLMPFLCASQQLRVLDAGFQNNCRSVTVGRMKRTNHRVRTSSLNDLQSKTNTTALEKLIYTHSVYPVQLLMPFRRLKYLDVSWNSNKQNDISLRASVLESYPLLEYLNIASYALVNIQRNALSHLHLRYLDLSSNHLGRMECSLSERLQNLPSLLELYLGNNRIKCLLKHAFQGLEELRVLDLSQNILETIEASLIDLKKLEILDLSNNRIQTLSQNTMIELNSLFGDGRELKINIRNNTLLCTCESLEFLKWLQYSRLHIVDLKAYVCIIQNESKTHLSDADAIVLDLERVCASYVLIIYLCSIALTFCLLMLASGLVYRFRWRLRYLYYMTKLRMSSRTNSKEYEQLYEFDAFISYAVEDFDVARIAAIEHLQIERGMRLCIQERDLQPGQSIQNFITKGIRNSKTTLLFLSNAFIADNLCMYQMNIARVESLYKKRITILIIVLDSIRPEETPLEVMDFINTYTYLEYPGENISDYTNTFWGKCAGFIEGH